MYWNHRVVDMSEENEGNPLFELREVFYDGDTGKPKGHGDVALMSDTMEGLTEMVDRLKEALAQPVLKPEDFRGEAK